MIALGDVAIMGGGCYGTFYLTQLRAARARHAVEYRQLLIVDRDPACQARTAAAPERCTYVTASWSEFLDQWLEPAARDHAGLTDYIVPTPLMPHLMAHWLERRARARWPRRDVSLVAVDTPLGTPYDRLHADGVRYVSFADWLCPTHCVEPLLCPVIKAPRTWEMGEALAEWTAARATERPTAAPALFTCRHMVYGVGMYPAHAGFDALDTFVPIANAPTGGDLVIGSVSACHGAVALLRVGPAVAEPGDVLYSQPTALSP